MSKQIFIRANSVKRGDAPMGAIRASKIYSGVNRVKPRQPKRKTWGSRYT